MSRGAENSRKGKSTGRTGNNTSKGGYNKSKKKAFDAPKKATPKKNDDGSMRLNKYIANAGICSRREADMYISVGNVTVNGKVINEMGYLSLIHI